MIDGSFSMIYCVKIIHVNRKLIDAILHRLWQTHTSVRAQLQLIAVHKNMFINSMMRNKIPNVIHSQRSHDGRIPPSSHAADITVDVKKKKNINLIFMTYEGSTLQLR